MNENDPDALVTIFRTKDSFTAGLIQSQLESEGIDCRLGGATQGYLPRVSMIEVLLRQRDVERALPLLRDFENPPPAGPSDEASDEAADEAEDIDGTEDVGKPD